MSMMMPDQGPDPTTAALLSAVTRGGGVPGQPDSAAAAAALRDAINALKQFVAAEQDEQDKAVAEKAIASLQGISAGRQKQNEAMMGTTPAHKAIARANAGGY